MVHKLMKIKLRSLDIWFLTDEELSMLDEKNVNKYFKFSEIISNMLLRSMKNDNMIYVYTKYDTLIIQISLTSDFKSVWLGTQMLA